MTYDFANFKKRIKELEEWFKKELSQIRTGRASPSLLDNVNAEIYGVRTPLNRLGAISTEDPRTLRLSLWDAAQTKDVEKAIMIANIGVSVAADDKGLRISFPELSSERRVSLAKIAKEKLEQSRVTLRTLRDECWTDIQKKEKLGGMSEDEKMRFKKEMEKVVQDSNKVLEDIASKKEKEIMS